jgi:hypothetical protein
MIRLSHRVGSRPGQSAILLAVGLLACLAAGGPGTAASPRSTATPPGKVSGPSMQLIETSPVETNLDHPAIPEAYETWKAMIDGATRSIEFAEFYASSEPGSRLEPILAAVEAAAKRGVKIRFLAENGFYKTYAPRCDA